MPVLSKKRVGPTNHPDHDRLVHELARHLGAGPTLPEWPKIIEEPVRLSDSIRVFVSWDEWGSVAEGERSEIILEAYKEARGMVEMLKVSVAMGVTPMEAKRLGMEFEG